MNTLTIIGMQWGDEGKGKVVDYFSRFADVVVRFQGGNNAGHTVVIGTERFIFHILPSGITYPDVKCVIGNGVVVDPYVLMEEIDRLRERNIEVDGRLFISEKAHLIMRYHKLIDILREERRGRKKIGTTGRGIGPAYEDKVARRGIRFCDLFSKDFEEKLQDTLAEKNDYITKVLDGEPVDFDELCVELRKAKEALGRFVADTSSLLRKWIEESRRIIFEGAQGLMLDVDHGTYPYVTSSNTHPAEVAIGAGVSTSCGGYVMGVAKAYTTRVGGGPFPTELDDKVGNWLRDKGGEYGATTGRPRRCGWLDLVVLKYAVEIGGIDGITITKLDVLSGLPEIKVCTGYRVRGEKVGVFPSSIEDVADAEPEYITFEGWTEGIEDVDDIDSLPRQAKRYISFIEEFLGKEVCAVSIGAERSAFLLKRNPFK